MKEFSDGGGENRCERCNRPLKDAHARYGWRCAEILGVTRHLNDSTDEGFDMYMTAVREADNYLKRKRIEKKNINYPKFIESYIKQILATKARNGQLWEPASIDMKDALHPQIDRNRNPIFKEPKSPPLSDYLDLHRNKAANSTNDRVIGNSDQSIGAQPRSFDSNKDEYSVIYRDDLNGIGILSDKTILYGKNVKPEDAYMLVALERMKQEGYSDEKINVAINNYLNGHEKQYGTSSVIREGKNIDYYTNFEDITDNLTKEMLRAQYEYATFNIDVRDVWPLFLEGFKNLVKGKSKFDLKQKEEWQNSSLYVFDGIIVDNDSPGNILYGFLGKCFGIPDEVLYAGAGWAQLDAGTSREEWLFTSYGDDPIDRRNIEIGINYYNKLYGK